MSRSVGLYTYLRLLRRHVGKLVPPGKMSIPRLLAELEEVLLGLLEIDLLIFIEYFNIARFVKMSSHL